MKIAHKVIFGFAVTVFLTTLIFLGGVIHLKATSDQYELQIVQSGVVIESLHEILIGGLRSIAATAEIVMLRESSDKGLKLKDKAIKEETDELKTGYRMLVEYHEKYNEHIQAYLPEDAGNVEIVGRAVDRLVNSTIGLVQPEEGLSIREILNLKEELEEADDNFTKVINEVIMTAEKDLVEEQTRMVTQNTMAARVLTGMFLLTIIWAILSVIMILKSFNSGMAQLSEASKKVAQADFNIEFRENRADEFDGLYAEFKKMSDEISSARSLADWSILKTEKYAAELKAKGKEYEEFVFVASHDLQEPLRKISTHASRVRKGVVGHVDEEYEDYVTKIIESSAYLREKLDMLAEYSRIVVNEGDFTKIKLDEVVGKVASRYMSVMDHDDATFNIDNLPTIDGKSDQLEKMFSCLFDNSCKFRGEKPLHIKVSSVVIEKENYCRIMLEDNGLGFEQKYAAVIFRVFHSLDNNRFGGLGMGLAIVKRIVEVHGGSISVESSPGCGARFSLIFPISQAERHK